MTTDILTRIRMTKLRTWRNAKQLTGWEGVITLDGEPAFTVSEEGNGGCNLYGPPARPRKGAPHWRETYEQIEKASREATGLDFEAFDVLTAYMENGDTAAQHVETVRQEYST